MGGRLKFYHLFSFVDSARGSLAHGMAPHTHMAEAYLLQWKCIYGGWRASQNASGPWCLIPFIVIINHFVNNLFDIATIKFAYQREILQACVYRYWFDDVVWCDWCKINVVDMDNCDKGTVQTCHLPICLWSTNPGSHWFTKELSQAINKWNAYLYS